MRLMTIICILVFMLIVPSALAVPVPRGGNFTWEEAEYYYFLRGWAKHGKYVTVWKEKGIYYFERAGKRCRF